VWSTLQPFLFWKGDTSNIDEENTAIPHAEVTVVSTADE
jgi:hypothetical protein